MKFEIKHRHTGKIIFECDADSIKLTLLAAIKAKCNLRGSDLRGSDLRGSNLSGSDLSDSDLRGSNLTVAWHVHHEILWEVLTKPIENRIAYIKSDKPKHEQETRLRLLKPIKGPLPEKLTKAAMEALHKKECPNCIWDGLTIFPLRVKP